MNKASTVANFMCINENIQHDCMDALPGQETLESMSLVYRALMHDDDTIDTYASNVLVLISKLWGMGLVMPSTNLESDKEYVYRNQITVVIVLMIITSI